MARVKTSLRNEAIVLVSLLMFSFAWLWGESSSTGELIMDFSDANDLLGVDAPGDKTWTIGVALGTDDLLCGNVSKHALGGCWLSELLRSLLLLVGISSLSLFSSSSSSSSDSGIDLRLDFLEIFLEWDSPCSSL